MVSPTGPSTRRQLTPAQSLSPATLRRLLRELNTLASAPPEGIRLAKETLGDEDGEGDMSDVRAWVEGPVGTPYAGGFFKLRFGFGADYPASPPSCHFTTKVFHPNVNVANGAVCVSQLKKDWTPDLGIAQILTIVKCLLIHPNEASALNPEAGRLLLEAYDDFAKTARMWTEIHATPRGGPPVEFLDGKSKSEVLVESNGVAGNSGGKKRSASSGSLDAVVGTEGDVKAAVVKPVPVVKKKTLKRL